MPIGDRERAARRPPRPVEAQPAKQSDALETLPGELAAAGEHRACECQIEARAGLWQISGREIRRYASGRELESGVADRGRQPPLPLAPRRVGESDDRKARQTRADVDLDVDVPGVQSVDRERVRPRSTD